MTLTLFTIGFAGQSAESFFTSLRAYGVRTVIDVRARPDSPLSGFARQKHLRFFLRELGGGPNGIAYRHEPLLAPPADLLKDYQDKRIGWDAYEAAYLTVLKERDAGRRFTPAEFDHAALLCACAKPEKCHRRVLAEYLQEMWAQDTVSVVHL